MEKTQLGMGERVTTDWSKHPWTQNYKTPLIFNNKSSDYI
jgi:hypothetical protein